MTPPQSFGDEFERKAGEESGAVHTHEGEPMKSFEVPVPERDIVGMKSGVALPDDPSGNLGRLSGRRRLEDSQSQRAPMGASSLSALTTCPSRLVCGT